MPSLSAQLNIDLSSLKAVISGQVNLLDEAKQEIEEVMTNPLPAIGDLALALRGLALPTGIDAGKIQEGFEAFKALIPTDSSLSMEPLTRLLDDFFESLTERLSLRVSGSFGLYESINGLLTMEWSLEKDVSLEQILAPKNINLPVVLRKARNLEELNPIIDAIESWRISLQQIPEPLTLSILLEIAYEGLHALPRHLYPFRYLPLLDELHDKLDTVQKWRHLTGEQLALNIGETTQKLHDYIQRIMIVEGVNATANRIENIANAFQPEIITTASTTLTQLMNELVDELSLGNTTGLANAVIQLQVAHHQLDQALETLQAPGLDEKIENLHREMGRLDERLEARMLELLASLNPPEDIGFLNLMLEPLNQMLENTGFDALVETIRGLFETLQSWIDKLNLSTISDLAEQISGESTSAIADLQNHILQATAELSAWMADARQNLEDLPLEQVKTTVEQGLNTFRQAIDEQVESIFAPVRQTLSSGLSVVHAAVEQFNPAVIIGQFEQIISQISAVLSSPEVLKPIDTVQEVMIDVNAKIGGFSVKVVADPVVEVIGIVEDALGIVASLPLSDSLKKDLEEALKTLKPVDSIRSILDEIQDSIQTEVEVYVAPGSIFAQFRQKLQTIQDKIETYSPSHFIGENLLKPYDELLDKLEVYSPSKLLEPINATLANVRRQLEQQGNPAALFAALEEPFDQLMAALNTFQPGALVKPLTDKFQDGIKTLSESIPTSEIDKIFDQVQAVSAAIGDLIRISLALRNLLNDLLKKLAGFANAESQMSLIAQELTSKLGQVQHFDAFEAGLGQVATAIAQTRAEPLSTQLSDALQSASQRIETLNASQTLSAMVAARQRFSPALMGAIPPSTAKTALQNFLDNFNPLSASYAAPFNKPGAWRTRVLSYLQALPTVFQTWDERFHAANSPFNDLLWADTSVSSVRTLLGEALEKQILKTFQPVFIAASQLHGLAAALLNEVEDLLETIEQQLGELVSAAEAIEALRDAINGLVQSIKNLDFSFIATQIQGTYDDLKNKLQALHPSGFKTLIDQAFQDLLAHMDLNPLLGLDEIEQQYLAIINTLRVGTSNGQSLDQVLSNLIESFKPVEGLLVKIDISIQIEAFFDAVKKLLDELEIELDRILDAYAEMYAAKTEISAKVGLSVSV